jgi:hypothetical protein
MPKPPREPDDLDAVMDRVADALDELEVVDGQERDALMADLREALGALDGLPLGAVEIRAERAPPELEPPAIAVLEGGRPAESGPDVDSPPPRASLQLAPPVEDGEGEPDDPDTAGADSTLSEPPGSIHLVPKTGAPATQAVFLGAQARAYRLRGLAGQMRVHVDDLPPVDLADGQTLDVEGRYIRVSAAVPTAGRYIRLRSQTTP